MTWTNLLIAVAIGLILFPSFELVIKTFFILVLVGGAIFVGVLPFVLLFRGIVKVWNWITGE